MILTSITIGTAGALLGFYLGVRSKAVAKNRALNRERRQVENLNTIVNRKAPPPPPHPRFLKEGNPPEEIFKYIEPGFYSGYKNGTFADTSICNSCNTIAYHVDMWTHNPCPRCGGKVRNYKPCKWEGKAWIKSNAQ